MDRGSGPSNARFLEDVGAVAARLEPAEGHNQGIVKAIAGRDILCAVVVMVVVGTVVRGILDLESGLLSMSSVNLRLLGEKMAY